MKQDSFRDFVLDQLREFNDIRCRAMFGGYGLYSDGKFLGIIFRGRLYFRTSDKTRGDYEERGMKPFKPNGRQTLRSYYEVPEDLLDDAEALAAWAQKALSGD